MPKKTVEIGSMEARRLDLIGKDGFLSKLLTFQTFFYIFAYYSTNHKEKSASFD